MIKTSHAMAAFAALAMVAQSLPASADAIERDVRPSWAPGYTLEDGQYVRDVRVPDGSNAPRTYVHRDVRDAWAVGFQRDEGGYYRDTIRTYDSLTVGPRLEREVATAWRPGFRHEDGQQVRDSFVMPMSNVAAVP